MTASVILILVWMVTYFGMLSWSLAKGRVALGGVALTTFSLIPMLYGRWTTPSEWHDSPLMTVYYLPTSFAVLLSLIVLAAGLVVKIRQARLTGGGA